MPLPTLDPQMAAALAKSAELAPSLDRVHTLPIDEIRRRYRAERWFWNEDRPELPLVVDDEIAGPAGPVFRECAIPCGHGERRCPEGMKCITIADGPGPVCRPPG